MSTKYEPQLNHIGFVATCFSPEISLMDEWIVAGAAAFLTKAHHGVEAFVEQAGMLVLASHSTEICRRWCNKAVWMEHRICAMNLSGGRQTNSCWGI